MPCFVEERYIYHESRALFGFALQSLGKTLPYCCTLIFTFFQARLFMKAKALQLR